MEYFNYKTPVKPAKGRLLLSEPMLADPNFERTLILLCEFDEDGAFGFVLNKPSESLVADLIDAEGQEDKWAFIGGPVQQDSLHFIHSYDGVDGAQEILTGIFWGGDFETVLEKSRLYPDSVRFFVGYSGWAAGQLEDELKENAWIVSDKADSRLIFDTNPEVMWQEAVSRLGGRFTLYANYPTDPRLN
mgnify:CR=1 FL=1